jgi:hypothetical protein
MKQIALFLIANGLEFQYFPQTDSFIYVKKHDCNYFFQEQNGIWSYVINNNDNHTFITIDSINDVIEFIKSIRDN